jgi:hypothetical protein
VLAVLASHHDVSAGLFAERQGAAILTPRDLSSSGWRLDLSRPEEAMTVICGRRIPLAQIDRVVVRLSHVDELDLGHISGPDRVFVAAEMQSFLVTLLTALGDRVLNRPSPACLFGPLWRAPQWLALAERLGIPAEAGGGQQGAAQLVTVLRGDCVGTWPQEVASHARRLAEAAGVQLLRACFSGSGGSPRLVGLDLWPDLESPLVGEAIASWFRD